MNDCEECIVYQIRHNKCVGEECPGCGKKTLIWKQSDFGTPYMECTECTYAIGVDLNTPCELDPLFSKKVLIVIEPQSELPAKGDVEHGFFRCVTSSLRAFLRK